MKAGQPDRKPKPQQVFVLAGQSNIVGRGRPLSLASPTDPRLLLWRDGAWEVAADPLGRPSDSRRGIGPGMTFGLKLLEREPDATIGLVMCARGGSSIRHWQPGQPLYADCVRGARATGTAVTGILFLQGEAEAVKPRAAAAWADGFRQMLTGLRADLGAGVPLLLGQIGNAASERFPAQQEVRDQQALAAATTPGVRLVRTLDLAVVDFHFTVDAYREIGARFATAWWQLRDGDRALPDSYTALTRSHGALTHGP